MMNAFSFFPPGSRGVCGPVRLLCGFSLGRGSRYAYDAFQKRLTGAQKQIYLDKNCAGIREIAALFFGARPLRGI